MRVLVVVPDPGFEQIAEDVERLGIVGAGAQELDELRAGRGFHCIQMQIGYEQRGHLGYIVAMSSSFVVTRFAPSPSGELHLGNARTALFNFLLARAHGGRFVLRVEDTDSERTQERYVEGLYADLDWLELQWDDGPYRQSQRSQLYARHFEQLEQAGHVYPCFCTPLELDLSRRAQLAAGRPPRYAGTCRELSDAERAARSLGRTTRMVRGAAAAATDGGIARATGLPSPGATTVTRI